MKAPQHTPGPWEVVNLPNAHCVRIFAGSHYVGSKEVFASDIDANARLIAAAPDMLAALVKLMEQYDSSPDFTMGGNLTNEPFLMARDALQKAGCEF